MRARVGREVFSSISVYVIGSWLFGTVQANAAGEQIDNSPEYDNYNKADYRVDGKLFGFFSPVLFSATEYKVPDNIDHKEQESNPKQEGNYGSINKFESGRSHPLKVLSKGNCRGNSDKGNDYFQHIFIIAGMT